MSFSDLGLLPTLVRACADQHFLAPTPVQSEAIPALLSGGDVLVQARTGSGKTAAYALPLLQQWLQGQPQSPRPIRALVLVPTRELALQVAQTLRDLAHQLPGLIKVMAAFGGVSINPQMMGLRGGADIMVATPGRLLDLERHNALSLRHVQTLVLDEADRLLDMGFADELNAVLDLLPAQRQNVLCSATFETAVTELTQYLLRDPTEVRLTQSQARPDILQRAILVDDAQRGPLLRHLLAQRPQERALVFVASRYRTELVTHKLQKAGVHAAAFHGDLSQGARTDVLKAFKQQRVRVLVATDMAARGLHIDALPLVVNMDLPRSPDDHVHRIGRTGREGHTGAPGQAISLVPPEAEAHFRLIEKRQGLNVPRETVPGFEPKPPQTPQIDPDSAAAPQGTGLDPMGGLKGRRKSKKDKLREAAALAKTGSR